MANFLRENIGIIITMIVIGVVVLGGIYWVEASLASQEQVIS
ncbi:MULTISPECIES: hypothetical protein [Pseudomonadati]|jgi:hypothetical protein|uniref:Uncharacterized protein n=1 Tax=Shewanella subflava TaxID=2986476 RepID=A0ABT3I5J4_9GAMM|nr:MULTISPECIES: hypothetical protein [Shewanella]MCW3171341.1 hypothetical protein [Shewanella subflava]MDP5146975.1 hypothetical protein [Shewanella sp. ULN5]